MYGGENDDTYNYYEMCSNDNIIFNDPNRSKDDVILGIESTFDESAASLINSFGEIKANHQITQWEQWVEFDGVDPKVGEEKHLTNVPKAINEALKAYGI
jgi:hypothetical protein